MAKIDCGQCGGYCIVETVDPAGNLMEDTCPACDGYGIVETTDQPYVVLGCYPGMDAEVWAGPVTLERAQAYVAEFRQTCRGMVQIVKDSGI